MQRVISSRVALVAALVLVASVGTAMAQDAGGFGVGPGQQPDRGEPAGGPAPAYSQDRTFGATRFWKLDKGTQQVEMWWRFRDPRSRDAYNILQLEYEIGVTDRVQLDIYENLTDEGGGWTREGTQIEARIAVDPVYGRTPLNPVVYLEWHPLHLGPARAEGKLLLGDAILGDKLFGAVNLFYEQNVTKSSDGMGGKVSIPNPEVGGTAAASYAVAGQRLRLGGEVKLAFEKELFADDRWERQLLIGPNISTRIAGTKLKLLATWLFGVTDDAKKNDAYLILATKL